MAKFELFQRLNTGGSMLSDQEVRNSILVMMNRTLYQWLRELSQDKNFISCVALSDRAIEEQYDMELVLRFIGVSDHASCFVHEPRRSRGISDRKGEDSCSRQDFRLHKRRGYISRNLCAFGFGLRRRCV